MSAPLSAAEREALALDVIAENERILAGRDLSPGERADYEQATANARQRLAEARAEARFELPGIGDPHPEGTALYVLVDEELRNTDARCAGAHLPAGAAYRVVHVISRWARGEIRGYILHRGELTVRQPCYSGDWPDLDALVRAALVPNVGGAS